MNAWEAWERAAPEPERPEGTAFRTPRRQLPAVSPLPLPLIAGAARDVWRSEADPRGTLREVLKAQFGADQVQLYASGTAALASTLRIASRLPGGAGPIALPAYTCFDVATAAVGADARVLFYDIDPATLSPDPTSLRGALRRGARIVVVTHLFGFPVDWPVVQGLVDEHGALLIEDAAQGHGAYLHDRPLGSLGQLSVLSFGRGKGWSGGRGGALLSRGPWASPLAEGDPLPDPAPSTELGILAGVLGQALLGRPGLYWIPASIPGLRLGESVYHEPVPPGGMSRLAAALVHRGQLVSAHAAWWRRRAALVWRREVSARPSVRHVQPVNGAVPGYLRYPMVLAHGVRGLRDRAAARRMGVEASYPECLLALPAIRARLIQPAGTFPGAEELARRVVTVPTHGLVSAAEIRRIATMLNAYEVWREPRASGRPGSREWEAQPRTRPNRTRRPEGGGTSIGAMAGTAECRDEGLQPERKGGPMLPPPP